MGKKKEKEKEKEQEQEQAQETIKKIIKQRIQKEKDNKAKRKQIRKKKEGGPRKNLGPKKNQNNAQRQKMSKKAQPWSQYSDSIVQNLLRIFQGHLDLIKNEATFNSLLYNIFQFCLIDKQQFTVQSEKSQKAHQKGGSRMDILFLSSQSNCVIIELKINAAVETSLMQANQYKIQNKDCKTTVGINYKSASKQINVLIISQLQDLKSEQSLMYIIDRLKITKTYKQIALSSFNQNNDNIEKRFSSLTAVNNIVKSKTKKQKQINQQTQQNIKTRSLYNKELKYYLNKSKKWSQYSDSIVQNLLRIFQGHLDLIKNEATFNSLLYNIFQFCLIDKQQFTVQSEFTNNISRNIKVIRLGQWEGRIDLLLTHQSNCVIIELKVNSSLELALRRALQYQIQGKVCKTRVGINYSKRPKKGRKKINVGIISQDLASEQPLMHIIKRLGFMKTYKQMAQASRIN